MRAGYRCENVVCAFVCHAPSLEHRAFEGCIVRTSIALPFIARFGQDVRRFIQNGLLFQMHYIAVVLIFVGMWRNKFLEMAVKVAKIQKIGGKVCAHHFV